MSFEKELTSLINKYSKENDSNTPDFILANYIMRSLDNFNLTMKERCKWYGEDKEKLYDAIDIEKLIL